MRKRLRSIGLSIAVYLVSLLVLGAIAKGFWQDSVAQARTTYYAQGVVDGRAQADQRAAKAPAPVQTMVEGFCSGAVLLSWFAPEMGVTQSDVAAYAAKGHRCNSVRYLGTVEQASGTDYVFILEQDEHTNWWVFSVNPAGQIADTK